MNDSSSSSQCPLLQMQGVSKSFAGVQALEDISLTLERGEVLALMGENGAGKSTLIKTLGGALSPDTGEILVNGSSLPAASPLASTRAGVAIIYQEFNLVPDLSVSENVFLGKEKSRWGVIDHREQLSETQRLLDRLGTEIDPLALCSDLSIAQQQFVEIAKALSWDAELVIMDEPTAALPEGDVDRLLQVVRELQRQGLGIIYVSHRLDEVFKISDRVMVLRDGRVVGDQATEVLSRAQLIEQMVGRSLDSEFPSRHTSPGLERLRVENLGREPTVRDVSFTLRAGEVLGIGGLAGSGRTELVRLLFGADRSTEGNIFINDEQVRIDDPRSAISHGICLLTEDRKGQGLVLAHSVLENFGLPNLTAFARGPFVHGEREKEAFHRFVKQINIKTTGPDQPAGHLSGGNQQKVVLAKWLARNSDIIIFDEPTRGIDVGAKFEIYQLINVLAAEGKSVIMISSELPELLGMSDRILVMHEGRITGEITDVSTATQEDVLGFSLIEKDAC